MSLQLSKTGAIRLEQVRFQVLENRTKHPVLRIGSIFEFVAGEESFFPVILLTYT
jgi:hypothetical protein